MTAPGPISVVLVEDHAMVLEGLRAVLGLEDDIEVVAAVSTVAEARVAIADLHPDVVVTDYQLPDERGIALAAFEPDTKVLLISGIERDGVILDAVRAGCSGFLDKGRGTAELAGAVRSVAVGGAVFPVQMLRRIARGDDRQLGGDLTERELEVLRLLARPMTVEAIAGELDVSVHTARNHVRSILSKLHARSQLEAVVTAVRAGLVEIA